MSIAAVMKPSYNFNFNFAGVNLSSTLKPMHPKVLHGLIVKNNAQIFNVFIEFPKPLLIAANGPAIGAW